MAKETIKSPTSALTLEQVLPLLKTSTPRPARFQTSPTPTESFLHLYRNSLIPPHFFINGAPSNQNPEANINAFEAHDFILQTLTTTLGTVASIEGPMVSCKSTLIELLAQTLPQAQVFKHGDDTQRF